MPPPLDSAFRKDVAPAAPVQWLQQVSKLLLYCPCVGVDLSIRLATRVSDRCKSPGAPKHLSRRLWPSQPQAYQLRGTHVSGNNTKEAQRDDYHRAQGPPGRVKGSSDSTALGHQTIVQSPRAPKHLSQRLWPRKPQASALPETHVSEHKPGRLGRGEGSSE
jgi:hypothetical protein